MLKSLCAWWCRLRVKSSCCKGQIDCEKDIINPNENQKHADAIANKIVRPLDRYYD